MSFNVGSFEENKGEKSESVTNLERQYNLKLFLSGSIQKMTGHEVVESRAMLKFEPYRLEADITPIDSTVLLDSIFDWIPDNVNPQTLSRLVALKLENSYETGIVAMFFIPKLATSDPIPVKNLAGDVSVQVKRRGSKVAVGIPQNQINWVPKR